MYNHKCFIGYIISGSDRQLRNRSATLLYKHKVYIEKEKFHLLDDSGLRKISWVNLALRFFTWVKRVDLGLRNISRVKRGQPGT